MLEDITNTEEFYARLTPLYHLIYSDWDKSMERQAAMLNALIREIWGDDTRSILDVSCGIGTQAIGLAKLGYKVTASDVSREEVKRAKVEAERREVKLDISVADMRQAFNHHRREFDLVVSCDNSVPHLLTDEDILTAFQQFQRCTRPGGGCLITVRDYEKEDLSKRQVKPYGIREDNRVRWILFQIWDPHDSTYDLTMYFVEDCGGSECRTYALRCSYYAIGIPKLMDLMIRAGFENVTRLDGKFFQPVIVGTRSITPAGGDA